MSKYARSPVLAVVIALVLAGCGGPSDRSGPSKGASDQGSKRATTQQRANAGAGGQSHPGQGGADQQRVTAQVKPAAADAAQGKGHDPEAENGAVSPEASDGSSNGSGLDLLEELVKGSPADARGANGREHDASELRGVLREMEKRAQESEQESAPGPVEAALDQVLGGGDASGG